jgi:hypothetical protein
MLPQTGLQPNHFFCAHRPHPDIHPDLWDVIAMAAVMSMDTGRNAMTAFRVNRPEATTNEIASKGRHVAMIRFNRLLAEFCIKKETPKAWAEHSVPNHPFIRWDSAQKRWVYRIVQD